MKIDLTDTLYVAVTDGYNYELRQTGIVQRETAKSYGQEFDRNAGYFNTLESAVAHAIKLELCTVDDAAEAQEVIDLINASLRRAAKVTAKLRSIS